MNVLTLNVCGFGDTVKWEWVRRLQASLHLNFIGLQETQLCDYSTVNMLHCWDDSDFDFEGINANGISGGLISIWNKNVFCKEKISKNVIT